jgi:hypothetical protein
MKSTIYLLTLCIIGFVAMVASIEANAQVDLSALKSESALGAGITKEQLPKIIASKAVYCANIDGKNYLASVGAMQVFQKTVTSRTGSVACNAKVKRQALSEGIEVIQLSKTKMTPEAYKALGQALTKSFGI